MSLNSRESVKVARKVHCCRKILSKDPQYQSADKIMRFDFWPLSPPGLWACGTQEEHKPGEPAWNLHECEAKDGFHSDVWEV